MQNKLRVLVVPDFFPWALGTWAKQIARFATQHDYYFFSQQMLSRYPDEWNSLLSTVDIVHFLNHWDVKNILVPDGLPQINTVTHVANEQEWEEQSQPLTQADAVVVIAEEWKQFLQAKGVISERIYLFNIGVDTQKFYPYNNKVAARRKLGIYSNSKLIGYCAKFSSDFGGRKGIDIFLESLKISLDSGCKFGVLISGPGWNETVGKLESYGIEVHYRPFLPDKLMPVLYNAVDLYVTTSRIEGGPIPVIESMACGVPVVTTPVGIVKDYLQDEVQALIIPKNDAQACSQAIMRLLSSFELRNQLANSALQFVKKQFAWKNTLAGIEELYTDVWQAKASNHKKFDSTFLINSKKQRNWAINIDSYFWHQQIYHQGYRAEGLRGMLGSSLKVGGKQTLMLMHQTLSTIKHSTL